MDSVLRDVLEVEVSLREKEELPEPKVSVKLEFEVLKGVPVLWEQRRQLRATLRPQILPNHRLDEVPHQEVPRQIHGNSYRVGPLEILKSVIVAVD